jgi:acyl phosphate:glycerol-3-phosphate acyltransferase
MSVPDLRIVAALATAYFLGAIPFAMIVARRLGVNIRAAGSGNPGATNVLRTSGAGAGALVAVLDIAKGAAGVILAEKLTSSNATAAAAGVAAVAGHVFPVWFHFRGGKGVATACGAFAVLAPGATVLAASVFAVAVLITRYVSVASMASAAALPSLVYVMHGAPPVLAAAFAVGALVLFRHRVNVARLLAGAEPRI